ncbi:MAG: NifB/NifX family molybdenum-iron cluster-binding protein [Candidatus Omnitrophica bacterium]|nr:NifB/NifX family molybdenum-iron cluster-binding protein [Candidatus Omnitrophota bacterium]
MKICITAEGDNLDSKIDPRFGRAQYFLILDTESEDLEAIQNRNVGGMGGVGVQSGQLISEKGVKVVLTGNVGPNAYKTLEAAGIEVISGVSGIVRENIEKYKQGEFKPGNGPSVDSKFGMN